MVGRVEPG
jgi:hypothetical protein